MVPRQDYGAGQRRRRVHLESKHRSQIIYCPSCKKKFLNEQRVLQHFNNRRSTCIHWLDQMKRLTIAGDSRASDFHKKYRAALGHTVQARQQATATADSDGQPSRLHHNLSTTGSGHTEHASDEDWEDEWLNDGPTSTECDNLPNPSSRSTPPQSCPTVDHFPGAAEIYGEGPNIMDDFDADTYAEERKENLYYPFASEDEWDVASFLLRSHLTVKELDNFFSLNLVSNIYSTVVFKIPNQLFLGPENGSFISLC